MDAAGAVGPIVCASCGGGIADGDRFCSQCGASVDGPVPPTDERKLVSAVVVDLVAFTALSESLDPEETRRLLEGYWDGVRRELERFGGSVEKFIGDAVVGVFGAPLAHEDDAERSVRAALAIRELARSPGHPAVRIAVARGLALVRSGARAEAGEALVVGDVITRATRLQEQAPRGGVLVDEPTQSATHGCVTYRRAPPLRMKGRREVLSAWRALHLRAGAGLERTRTAFVDRENELALLRSLLVRARASRAVQLVTVLGEPGIGKTRLVHELGSEGALLCEARALAYGEEAPFAPLAEIVETLLGPDEPTAHAEALLAATVPDETERKRVALRLCGLRGGDPSPAAPTGDPLPAFAAARRLIEAAAADRPLVLVFEDVHWADDVLLDFLEHLVEWAAPVPLLVLCTARPDLMRRRPTWGGGRVDSFTISLGPLPDADVGRLLGAALGRPPDPPEVSAVLARAGGNPLYAEELAHVVREGTRPLDGIPDTLQAVIAARLDRLPPSTKRILSDAAVAGASFSPSTLAALTVRDASELETGLHDLERLELLVRRDPDGDWAFRHGLVREVAYTQLPRSVRADAHVALAAWLEEHRPDASELIAHHWLRAREERSSDEPASLDFHATRALSRAGERALQLGAFVSAVRLYAQALELCPETERTRATLLLGYARALWNAEVGGEATALEAHDALLAAGEPDTAAAAAALLSEMHWYRGDREAALSHLGHAVELIAERPASPEKALVLSRLARTRMLAADYDGALVAGRDALALAEQLDELELQAEALNSIGSARVRHGDAGGFADLERATELAAGTRAAVVAYNNLGALLAETGHREASDAALEKGRALAAELGDKLHLEWFEAEQIGRRARDGDWDAALAEADAWLAAPQHPAYPTIGVRATRALLRHARGDSAGALADVAGIEDEARGAGDPQTLVPNLAEAAFILLEEGDDKAARERVREALGLCERSGDTPPLAAVDLAIVAVACGLTDRAGDLFARGPSSGNVWCEAARAYLRHDPARAAELLERAGGQWQAAYMRLRTAEEGQGDIRMALDYYRAVGADRYVRRCSARTPRVLSPTGS